MYFPYISRQPIIIIYPFQQHNRTIYENYQNNEFLFLVIVLMALLSKYFFAHLNYIMNYAFESIIIIFSLFKLISNYYYHYYYFL